MNIRVGIINGEKAELSVINEYATIPSYEGLLTMLAAGMMEHVRNLAIGLNSTALGSTPNSSFIASTNSLTSRIVISFKALIKSSFVNFAKVMLKFIRIRF